MNKAFLLSLSLMSATSLMADTAFEAKLTELGISKASCKNLSSSSEFSISEPSCAYANISGISTLPTEESGALKAYIDFYDNQGSYFQKKILLSLQGSEKLAKISFTIDLCEDNWVGDETTSITIGDWVAQDSYHLKGFYEDGLRGTAEVAYNLYSQMTSHTLCVPKAFPVILYINGDFYGIMSWQLKKHRDNYNLDKKNSANILLDGKLSAKTLWKGSVDWTAFEVRNPKDLYDMQGNDYDGDNPVELMDATSSAYSGKTKQVRCAEAKAYIQKLSQYDTTLVKLAASGASEATMKANISKYFDVPELINYRIFSLVSNNYDGFAKNWLWFTSDGTKWSVAPYGCELTFGYNDDTDDGYTLWTADRGSKKYDYHMQNTENNGPMRWITAYYQDELKARYEALCDTGLLSVPVIDDFFFSWVNRIGIDNYTAEFTRWPESPFHWTEGENIFRINNWVMTRLELLDTVFGEVSISEIRDNEKEIVSSYTPTGIRISPNEFSDSQKGFRILRFSDGTCKKVIR